MLPPVPCSRLALPVLSAVVVLAFVVSDGAAARAGEDMPNPPVESGASARRAYRAGRLVPADAPEIPRGTLLVKDGRIERILGAREDLPSGVEVTDLGDEAVVLPVLVNPLSQVTRLGPAVRSRRSGVISSARGGVSDGQKAQAVGQVDPGHRIWERLVATGYGVVAVVPATGNLVSGRAAIVRPRKSETRAEIVVEEDDYLLLAYSLGKPWHDKAEQLFKKAIENAKAIREAEAKGKADATKDRAGEAAEKKEEKPNPSEGGANSEKPAPRPAGPPAPDKKDQKGEQKKPPPDPDPLTEVFLGKRRAVLVLRSPAVIDHALRLLDSLEEPFDFTLVTDAQEPDMVEKLAGRVDRIKGVILEPRMGRIYDTSILINTARAFDEAGIPVAFVPLTDDLVGHRDVFFAVAQMVKGGMSPGRAIRAVTAVPARMLGIDDRFGSLAAGKEASFVVFDGDPLGGFAEVKHVFHRGEEVYPEGKATDDLVGASAPEGE